MIFVNFKIYPQTFGQSAIDLAKICQQVRDRTHIPISLIVSPFDIFRLHSVVDLPLFLQRFDRYPSGAHNGAISALQGQKLGAAGGLINHSESRTQPGTIPTLLSSLPDDFQTILCLRSIGQLDRWASGLSPTYFAYEPPYLISSPDRSVASEEPQAISNFVAALSPRPLLVGAGIHSAADVRQSIKLGAKGIIVASDIVTSADPAKELADLASGFTSV